MAVQFPLAADQFFEGLRITSMSLSPSQPKQMDRSARGEIFERSMGETLWVGSISLALAYHADQSAFDTVLDVASRAGATFLAFDSKYKGPRKDPGGGLLGSAAPSFSSVWSNNKEFSLKGLPAGYEISRGDLIGFQYGTNPVRRKMLRVFTGGAANGAGVTPMLEASFPLRGMAANISVELIRPVITAHLIAPQYGGSRPFFTDGASFQFIQTLG